MVVEWTCGKCVALWPEVFALVPLAPSTSSLTSAPIVISQQVPHNLLRTHKPHHLYDGQYFRAKPIRNKPYTTQEYVTELKEYTDAIIKGVPELPSGNIFHVASLADQSVWSAEDLYNSGLGNISRIKAFTEHYYQSSIKNPPTMLGTYLNHSGSVLHKTDENPQENLDYFHSAKISIPIIISEVGSALGSVNDFEQTIDAVLDSALWEVDWIVLAMSKGISRVNMNQCNGCNSAS